jgi:hypothetical protein
LAIAATFALVDVVLSISSYSLANSRIRRF